MNIKEQLKNFVELLNLYWFKVESLNLLDESKSFKDDWLQANWELIVERPFSYSDIYLETYGEGADCNGFSSRILFPERIATHRIILEPISGDCLFDELGKRLLDPILHPIIFDKFTAFREDWYFEEPPFDMVQANCKDEIVIIKSKTANMILVPYE